MFCWILSFELFQTLEVESSLNWMWRFFCVRLISVCKLKQTLLNTKRFIRIFLWRIPSFCVLTLWRKGDLWLKLRLSQISRLDCRTMISLVFVKKLFNFHFWFITKRLFLLLVYFELQRLTFFYPGCKAKRCFCYSVSRPFVFHTG